MPLRPFPLKRQNATKNILKQTNFGDNKEILFFKDIPPSKIRPATPERYFNTIRKSILKGGGKTKNNKTRKFRKTQKIKNKLFSHNHIH